MTELTFYPVSGDYRAILEPPTHGASTAPRMHVISALVDFIPRLPPGHLAYVADLTVDGHTADTAIAIPTITAQISGGRLCTQDVTDAPDIELIANTANLGLPGDLIIDVRYYNVQWSGATNQKLLPFAYIAPSDNTPICITDPDLQRLAYQPQERRYPVWTG